MKNHISLRPEDWKTLVDALGDVWQADLSENQRSALVDGFKILGIEPPEFRPEGRS